MMDVTLIDGRSGSGKTELASLLARHIPGAQVLRLDDLYRGWDGLEAASAAVPMILATGTWQDWDWKLERPGGFHRLNLTAPIIVEGVGALSRASRPLAHTALWLTTDDSTRKTRALTRDGETFAPHWERWAAQEEIFIAREDPASLADVVIET